jgi:hypothetical protein
VPLRDPQPPIQTLTPRYRSGGRVADNPNIALVQRFFAAYADHDF